MNISLLTSKSQLITSRHIDNFKMLKLNEKGKFASGRSVFSTTIQASLKTSYNITTPCDYTCAPKTPSNALKVEQSILGKGRLRGWPIIASAAAGETHTIYIEVQHDLINSLSQLSFSSSMIKSHYLM